MSTIQANCPHFMQQLTADDSILDPCIGEKNLKAFLICAALCAAIGVVRAQVPEGADETAPENDPLNAVVKLEIQTATPDFVRPWRTNVNGVDGSGVVIGPGRILTCAHCVADSTYIRVRKNNEDSLYHGAVEAIDNDCDLALVRVEGHAFMKDVTPMEIGETPPVQSDVLAVGYPIGGNGISFTRGIVSRIEDIRYEQGFTTLLAAQVDAAINPGNSGGPVLDLETGKIGGIAFQGNKRGESLGYMIPTEIIRRFLRDVSDGRVDGVPDPTFAFSTLESEAARRFLGMDGAQTGVLVENVVKGGTNASPLRAGDVVLSVGGYNVANNGNIRIEGNEIRQPRYAFYMRQIGETVPMTILRNGTVSDIELPIRKIDYKIRRFMYDTDPDWYLLGSFVFTTTSYNYLFDIGPDIHDPMFEDREFPDEEFVVISAVMPDVCAEGYLGMAEAHVRTVNGVKIRNLRHLVTVVEDSKDEFLRFELDIGEEWDSTMILDAAQMRAATPRVMERYAIPADRSPNLH